MENDNSLKTFTLEDLAYYNGEEGKPAYVAVKGVVYDVTDNSVWKGKNHFGNDPGNDLTEVFEECHPGAIVLSVLPIVGHLE